MSTAVKTNKAGLSRDDYKGRETTLCKGCGHNSISNQIISAAYELGLKPHQLIKLSGIGCSSKSPAYFLGQSFGFNSVHGRMPTIATGALMANRTVLALGVSGDGDTGSIGLSHFKHMMRRNIRLVYLVENNGVYGLTKGQFSATAEEGLELKAGRNSFPQIDLCAEALASQATFVARSFSGDTKQLRSLLMAALSHRGTAVLDVISPCVTFNDRGMMSYMFGKEHQEMLHEITYVPPSEEIMVDYEPGTHQEIKMHDGSSVRLWKLEEDYDPSNRGQAIERVEEARAGGEFITGLIYCSEGEENFAETLKLVKEPLSTLPESVVRPSKEALAKTLAAFGLATS